MSASTRDSFRTRHVGPTNPLRNFLSGAIFSAHVNVLLQVEGVLRGVVPLITDLQTKVQKYETKANQCEERVRQAADSPQRAFFEVLARYYSELATDFRQVIGKRNAA